MDPGFFDGRIKNTLFFFFFPFPRAQNISLLGSSHTHHPRVNLQKKNNLIFQKAQEPWYAKWNIRLLRHVFIYIYTQRWGKAPLQAMFPAADSTI